jgi:hypothetical protein
VQASRYNLGEFVTGLTQSLNLRLTIVMSNIHTARDLRRVPDNDRGQQHYGGGDKRVRDDLFFSSRASAFSMPIFNNCRVDLSLRLKLIELTGNEFAERFAS